MGAVQVQVRRLERVDCTLAAGLHADQLPHGFSASLGPRRLRRYYAAFAASPHAIALVARSGGETVGVLVGTARNAAHYRWVLRHRGVALAGRGLAAMLLRPRGRRALRQDPGPPVRARAATADPATHPGATRGQRCWPRAG